MTRRVKANYLIYIYNNGASLSASDYRIRDGVLELTDAVNLDNVKYVGWAIFNTHYHIEKSDGKVLEINE